MNELLKALKNRQPSVLEHENLLKSAVLIPLIKQNDEICVLFEERAHHMRRQPGEIGFPGGRIDPMDDSPEFAAVRETCEELGIDKESIEVIGQLDYVVTPFQMVFPFVGFIKQADRLRPNPDEVANVFCVPLDFLLKETPELYQVDLQMVPPEDFPFDLIPNGRNYKWRHGQIPEYFYKYQDRVIWGLTARILRHFLQLIASETESSLEATATTFETDSR